MKWNASDPVICDLVAEVHNLRAENARLQRELAATDAAWQNAELREAALRKRIEESPVVTLTKFSNCIAMSEPKTGFDDLALGESCKVRLVIEVE